MADAKFLDFFDMIDGGGAGKMGDKFEGGGLLSVLGNMFASPYGSKDEERRKRLMQMRGLLDVPRPINRPKKIGTVGDNSKNYPVGDEGIMGLNLYENPSQAGASEGIGDLFGNYNYSTKEEIDRMREAQRMLGMNNPMGGPNPRVQEEIARRREARRKQNALARNIPTDPRSVSLTTQAPYQPQSAAPLPQNMPQDPTSKLGGFAYENARNQVIEMLRNQYDKFDTLEYHDKEGLIRRAMNAMMFGQ